MVKVQENTDEIIKYFRKNLAKGYKLQDLKWTLIKQNYSKILVDKAIKIIDQEQAKQIPIAQKIQMQEQALEDQESEIIISEKKGFWKRIFG